MLNMIALTEAKAETENGRDRELRRSRQGAKRVPKVGPRSLHHVLPPAPVAIRMPPRPRSKPANDNSLSTVRRVLGSAGVRKWVCWCSDLGRSRTDGSHQAGSCSRRIS
jgi:hypothetical protein